MQGLDVLLADFVQNAKKLRNGLGTGLERMGITWGSEMGTPSPAHGCLSNCKQIAPSPLLSASFMCLGTDVKLQLGVNVRC